LIIEDNVDVISDKSSRSDTTYVIASSSQLTFAIETVVGADVEGRELQGTMVATVFTKTKAISCNNPS
jgi:hypothetical protein